MKHKHQITCAAKLESLPVLRAFLDSACSGHPRIDDPTLYDLHLALDEACTNIVIHGYRGLEPGDVKLEVELAPDLATLTLTDQGHTFDPRQAPAPNVEARLEDRPVGGLGIYLIRQTMDDVRYETNGNSNRLIMVKNLPEPG